MPAAKKLSIEGHASTSEASGSDVAIPNSSESSICKVEPIQGSSNIFLENDDKKVDPKLCSKYPELFEPHTFAPKDLLALLKNLENEINTCELNLRDENEKRRKYKVC